MPDQSPRILQLSTFDVCGGAERIAMMLHQSYLARGLDAWLAVGEKRGTDPQVLPIPNAEQACAWERFWLSARLALRQPQGFRRYLGRVARLIAQPGQAIRMFRGIEEFNFPATRRLLELPPRRPDILHAHNLHGGYFDLRALPFLSAQIPMLLTLHDTWLLAGHCAYSLDCERWETGCGHCPNLGIYPPVNRDATAANWRRKQEIFRRSRVCITAPSRWLMNKVEQSMLAPAVIQSRVIHNGVDRSIFTPGDQRAARQTLGLPKDARILLFSANGVRLHPFKDYRTLREAVGLLSHTMDPSRLLFLALGDDSPPERVGAGEIRFIPFHADPKVIAMYNQAADIYLHPAKADTFPNSIIEALSCGRPTVATAVGGIPEQINGLSLPCAAPQYPVYDADQATGVLVPAGDAQAFSQAVRHLLSDDALLRRLSDNAASEAARRFDAKSQIDEHLNWYPEIIQNHSQAKIAR